MTKPQTVLLSLAAAGVTAAVAGALLFFFAGSQNGTAAPAAPAAITARSDSEQGAPSVAATAPAAATTAATAVSASVQVQKETTAAAAADGESVFFSGVYAPDSRAEDIATGDVVHVRALFGSGYTDGMLTFDSDGAFSDTLVTPEGRTGTYRAEGDNIRLVGLSGQAPEITVTAWKDDGVTPATFCAVYKTAGDTGYRVFFSEK